MSIRTARRRFAPFVIAGLLLALVIPTMTVRGASFSISLPLVASGFQQLTQVTNAGDGSGRLFLVERRGVIYAWKNGSRSGCSWTSDRWSMTRPASAGCWAWRSTPTSGRPTTACSSTTPATAATSSSPATRRNAARTAVIRSTGQNILVIEHSAHTNHNGGAMAFGPNGYAVHRHR